MLSAAAPGHAGRGDGGRLQYLGEVIFGDPIVTEDVRDLGWAELRFELTCGDGDQFDVVDVEVLEHRPLLVVEALRTSPAAEGGVDVVEHEATDAVAVDE